MSQQKPNVALWGLLVSVIAVIVIVGVLWVTLMNGPAGSVSASATQRSAIAPQTTATLAAPSPSTTSGQQATDDAVATLAAVKAASATARAIELTAAPYPTAVPGATGVRADEYQKLEWAKQGLMVENGFGGVVDGNSVGVWAGAHASDPAQGVVQVLWAYPNQTLQVRLLTPGRHGSVHIVDEENNRLTLVSTDNTTFYFDLPGLAFASSLTEVVPTITAAPLFTPGVPSATVAPATAYP